MKKKIIENSKNYKNKINYWKDNNLTEVETTMTISNDDNYNNINENFFDIYFSNDFNNEKYNFRKSCNNNFKNFKTEICKNYQLKGFCKYNNSCSFAHGSYELRNKIIENILYKTKHCISFKNGYCSYGFRCQYIHLEKKFKEKLENFNLRMKNNLDLNKNNSILYLLLNKVKINIDRLEIFRKLSKF